ncbi:helix-turn-helix transcriptional regulator, partial [Escherichia coli]|uniref:helix-turn-helix transcriptional regulator n=3 Tax=Escherichia coli TaxID=562 RepID=UPI002023B8DB
MSLKAIATALGISVTTVSRALGGFSDVAASTRERVEAEARRRGYRPNTQARRLKTGKTDAVGLVYPENDVPFNSGVFMDMSLFRILCKCLFSEVTVQAVTELDNKA